ncbi:E3.2.1.14 [Mytilus coruscus]|uniref:E3.2.1.14 n=1 Tax=Mytilus coruscus TaxID=42192 RepID=A0A6J8CHE1_MYTCO|nr:E3.2.1.14 [Mytilus coruscus]
MASDVDPYLCTHVIYAFAKVVGNNIIPYEWNDINEWAKGQFEMIRDVRGKNPALKILIAIGGWNHGSAPFTKMVATQSNIDEFSTNSMIFLRANGFDGLDLDWEYPANRGSPPEDKQKFTQLVKTLRTKYDNEVLTSGQSRLLLTAAVAAGKSTIESAYEINKIAQHLDFINLMSYDLFSDYNSVTQHNSPLYESLGPNEAFNVDFAVKMWLNGGTPKHKLIVGMATYGRSFTLRNIAETGFGAPTTGQGTAGTYTREKGFQSYYEICTNINNHGWTEGWLEDQQVPYAYKGDQWVGFDNPKSIEIKTKYIIDNGLGGGMIWAIDIDDFHGICGHGKYPIMQTMRKVFNGTAGPPVFEPTSQSGTSSTKGSTTYSSLTVATTKSSTKGLTSYSSTKVSMTDTSTKRPMSKSSTKVSMTDTSTKGRPMSKISTKVSMTDSTTKTSITDSSTKASITDSTKSSMSSGLQEGCKSNNGSVDVVLGILLAVSLAIIIVLILFIFKLKGYEVMLWRVTIKKIKARQYNNLQEPSNVLPNVGYASKKVNHQSEIDQSVSTEPRF